MFGTTCADFHGLHGGVIICLLTLAFIQMFRGGGGFLFWVMFILLITYENIVEITYCSFTSSAFGFTISDNNNFAYLSSVEL